MGIRLYMRNKTAAGEEFCLGKLYYYLEERDNCNESALYLLKIGAIDKFLKGWDYEYISKIDQFYTMCMCFSYIEYGDFFELYGNRLYEFLGRYFRDWKTAWGYEISKAEEFYNDACKFIDEHSDGSIFEFRLGA